MVKISQTRSRYRESHVTHMTHNQLNNDQSLHVVHIAALGKPSPSSLTIYTRTEGAHGTSYVVLGWEHRIADIFKRFLWIKNIICQPDFSAENHLLKRQINEFDPNRISVALALSSNGNILEETAVTFHLVICGLSNFYNASWEVQEFACKRNICLEKSNLGKLREKLPHW